MASKYAKARKSKKNRAKSQKGKQQLSSTAPRNKKGKASSKNSPSKNQRASSHQKDIRAISDPKLDQKKQKDIKETSERKVEKKPEVVEAPNSEKTETKKYSNGIKDEKADCVNKIKVLPDFKRIALVTVLVLALVGVALSAILLFIQEVGIRQQEAERAAIEVPEVPEEELMDNPIDFASLQARNPDIYAWITVPNTSINLPILQSGDDMDFYLEHNMDGDYSQYGEIYSHQLNTKDFDDPVTVLYGHNFYGTDIMFTNLHNFEDAGFFAENSVFYIYTPHKVLTYQIVSVRETGNELILSAHDFLDKNEQQKYFDTMVAPIDGTGQVRSGVSLVGGESRIVQLSTCTEPSNSAKRFIVTGVLVDEKQTK